MPLILPTAERRTRLRKINRHLLDFKAGGRPESGAIAASLALGERDFVAELKSPPRIERVEDLKAFLWRFLYHFLCRRDYVSAALILWGEDTFSPEPKCVQLSWNALFDERMIAIIGGGGMGKTFSASAWLLLDWVLDPEWTRVQVASNSEDHLRRNLFADITRLHQSSALELPGEADAESIAIDKKTGMGIFILTLPAGPLSRGKIKGTHTKPRPAHPLFGTRSRVRMIIDEAQEVAQNIFDEIPNRFSTVAPGDQEHIKFLVTANPKFKYSKFGAICKPKGGWDTVSRFVDRWESEEGWTVISLDAMKHENVVRRSVVFPGFVTYDGVELWMRRCHGDLEHPDMYTYVYGKFPPEGTRRAVIRSVDIDRSQRDWIFDGPTTRVAFSDLAFTGDFPTFGEGTAGRAVGWVDRQGVEHKLPESAWKLQLDFVKILPRGDTQDLADEIMGNCRILEIKPHNFGDDRTGVGQGVHDTVRRQWKKKVGAFNTDDAPDTPGFEGDENAAPIYGIHFGQSATETKVAEEDTENCRELYDGIRSEVWYAAGRLFEFDVIGISRGIDDKTIEELTARQGGRIAGKQSKLGIESKDDYKARTGAHSPDRADTVTGVIHMARMTIEHLLPKARDTKAPPAPTEPLPMADIADFGSLDISGFGAASPMETMRD